MEMGAIRLNLFVEFGELRLVEEKGKRYVIIAGNWSDEEIEEITTKLEKKGVNWKLEE